ncbi:MAG: DUF134 domain-containing protein [Halothermotrichaceae bacterium]
MVRPTKERRVEFIPKIKYFKPSGIPLREIEEIRLSIEEIEAVRLKDLKGLTQEEAAGKMNISRPTYQRVLTEARKKIAEALIKGKAIRFEGGDYKLAEYLDCEKCGSRFRRKFRHRGGSGNINCPDCE